MLNLDLTAYGVVSPGGHSLAAIEQKSSWPTHSLPRLIQKNKPTAIHPVDLSSLSHWQKQSRLRRATPLTYFLVEAVDQCLKGIENRERLGLIVVHFTGTITYSRRFYQEIVEQSPRMASPMMFPETVFNSPASHVVAQHKIGGPVYSLLGDETAWLSALETAALWLQLNKADQVIVAAAYEIDAISVEAYHAAGWIRKGMIPTEGAAALLLQKATPLSSRMILETNQGFLYQTKEDFSIAKREIEQHIGKPLPQPLPLWNPWTSSKTTPPTPHGFGLSAGWETIRSLHHSGKQLLPILGANHQGGFLRLQGEPSSIDE